jgi:hypothetical protein
LAKSKNYFFFLGEGFADFFAAEALGLAAFFAAGLASFA